MEVCFCTLTVLGFAMLSKTREPEMILRSTDPISSLTRIVGNLRTFSEVSRKNRLPRAEIRNWEKS